MTIVVREQLQESSYFEALLEPMGVRSLLLQKTPYQDCTIFNIQYLSISCHYRTNIQYQYQYGLTLILNTDKSTGQACPLEVDQKMKRIRTLSFKMRLFDPLYIYEVGGSLVPRVNSTP